MFDITSIGDTTTDVFLDVDEATVDCDIDKDICRLCINYADKVPVRSFTKVFGVGNAANNAVGCVRLGLNTALYTVLGKDSDGHAAYEHLEKEGVVTDYIFYDEEKCTNYSTVINFDGERTILVYHEKRDYQLPVSLDTKWIYYTSAGEGHEKLTEQVLKHVSEKETLLAFNPGTFQLKSGLEALTPLLAHTNVLFVNKHEAETLLMRSGPAEELLVSLYDIGPKIVVITDGPRGAWVYDGEKTIQFGVLEAPVVERTGCGDAFATAFLGAIIVDKTIEDAMKWGSANGASVLQKIGAQQGLLSQKEIEDILAHAPNFQPINKK